MTYGLGVLRYRDTQLSSSIGRLLTCGSLPLADFNPHMLSNLLYGFGHVLHCPPGVLTFIEAAARQQGYGAFTS